MQSIVLFFRLQSIGVLEKHQRGILFLAYTEVHLHNVQQIFQHSILSRLGSAW